MGDKAVVLHSGGLDSTVCLHKALQSGREVLSLSIDYGQRHRIELEYAAHQCRKLKVSHRVIGIEWDKPARIIPVNRELEEIRQRISPAFLPGRNALFLALAIAEASGIGANEVWAGMNAIDFSGYPDCRPEFVDAFQKMIDLAIPSGPKIVVPLIRMSKREIAELAVQHGIVRSDTWSCYQPVFGPQGITACGRCDACILHEHAWRTVDLQMNRQD